VVVLDLPSDCFGDHDAMPCVELPGVHLWYHDSGGNGAPVVFMHAASGTGESWVYQLPAFTTAGYRCLTYDRRGWGRSRPALSGEQPGSVSDDLHGLAEHLGLGRFHLATTGPAGRRARRGRSLRACTCPFCRLTRRHGHRPNAEGP
jgi:hypothetical protein